MTDDTLDLEPIKALANECLEVHKSILDAPESQLARYALAAVAEIERLRAALHAGRPETPQEKPMQGAEARYFTNREGFFDSTAYIRADADGRCFAVETDGKEWLYSAGSLDAFIEKVHRGIWRELTADEAKALTGPNLVEKLARAFATEYITGHRFKASGQEEKMIEQLMVVMLAFHANACRQHAAVASEPADHERLRALATAIAVEVRNNSRELGCGEPLFRVDLTNVEAVILRVLVRQGASAAPQEPK